MNNNIVVHISEVNISVDSGMGRVEYHWMLAFQKLGYDFVHIGPAEVGKLQHAALFPYKAYKYYKKLNITPKLLVVHEPAAGYFVNSGVPCFVESHGVERRCWEAQIKATIPINSNSKQVSLKTRLLYPIWRLRNCDKGLKHANKLLLINSEDLAYVKSRYKRSDKDIFIFQNGINPFSIVDKPVIQKSFSVLFNGSWIERKGISTLVQAAGILHKQGLCIEYIIIGTGMESEFVLNDWPVKLRPYIKVIERFTQEEELNYLASSSIFVLPSYFEGQPLSLLQAMAAGKCCITTNSCGQKDIIDDMQNGMLFTAGDFMKLAGLISYCYNKRDVISKIGKNARKSVQNRNWQNVSDDVVNFITSNL